MQLPRRGFSLLEVMIAASLFLLVVSGVVTTWKTTTGFSDTQRRRSDAVSLGEDVLDDLRLAFRGDPELTLGSHIRFYARDRGRLAAAADDGYEVEWRVVDFTQQTFRRVELVVRWRGVDQRKHELSFVTFRPG